MSCAARWGIRASCRGCVAALDRLRQRMDGQGIAPDVATEIVDGSPELRQLRLPGVPRVELCAHRVRDGYLKTHYPAEFFAALLNSWPMGFYPVSTLDPRCAARRESKCGAVSARWRLGVHARGDGSRERPALRIGWRHVRGVGETAIDALRAARDRSQGGRPFDPIADVVSRAALDDQPAAGHSPERVRSSAWEPDRRRAGWEALRVAGDRLPLAPARTATGRDTSHRGP